MYNVAIIGAGPAGCTLARLLINENINVTVFEGNSEPRPDGGSLDLHDATGLAAMKKAGLLERFQELARYDGESFQVTDKRGVHLLNMSGATKESSRGRPEIDRPVLVHMLVDSLPEGVIKFSRKLRSIDDDLTLHFDQETVSGFDLIVGGDGAWSKTRKYLSDVQPYYSGISGYQFNVKHAKENEPTLSQFVRGGSTFCFSDRKGFMSQQMGDGSVNSSGWFVQREPVGLKDDEAVAHVRDMFSDWAPHITRAAYTPHSAPTTFRPLYMLPIGFRWFHRRGVTLIGDAAHLMLPFAGEGVNAAMKDAMELADHIVAASKEVDAVAALDRHVEKSEDELFVRAEKFTKHTWDMTTAVFHEPGFPWNNFEKYVLTAASDEVPGFMWPFVVVMAHAYFSYLRWRKAPKEAAKQ